MIEVLEFFEITENFFTHVRKLLINKITNLDSREMELVKQKRYSFPNIITRTIFDSYGNYTPSITIWKSGSSNNTYTLDIRQQSIEDYCFKALDLLDYKITKVKLLRIEIDSEFCKHLSKFFKKNNEIKTIELFNTRIKDESDRDLLNMLEETFSHIKSLEELRVSLTNDNNTFPSIVATIIKNKIQLKKLEINDSHSLMSNDAIINGISKLHELESLKIISVTSFPISFLDNLNNLMELHIRINTPDSRTDDMLVGITENTFSNLTSLKELVIHGSNLKAFPSGICKLEKLETLTLSNNKFTSLPNELGNLKNLRSLRLQESELETLGDGIYDLINLESYVFLATI